ncbi:uncharacterized protein VICG_01394 [Vittaforma corneae ATCC 50505]|uniref:Sec1 family protein n=1 Tax=Vittaforma corneae (strain ATCC 50505) TaxID=993615 RepID=L2GM04_VITCO|nr:uncharacterized protein VICG_01394 [Vittaforma corneae ATCC 50505]ELA41530.1 hypothetical protein VICG_01394 [Vittaforma corneae ATCC 50505]
MESLFYPQIEFILKRGTGIKACLFDSESKQMISNLIPLSVFRDNGFFYFDYLTNKNRTKVDGMCCIVIVRPCNLKVLLEEIVCPFYGNYIILFTTQIDPFVLEIMANTDIHSVISEVHEINLDLYRQSLNLYTTNSLMYKRNFDALFSLLLSLEMSPSILALNESSSKENIDMNESMVNLGRDLCNKIAQFNFQKRGTLVLLKRNFDLITPLLYDWHYFSMINEHFDLENSIVKVNNRDYLLNDAFFNINKFKQIAEVGEQIKIFIKEVEKNKLSIDDFEEIQEMVTQKTIAEVHLSIYNRIINEAVGIQQISEIENEVLVNKDISIARAIENLGNSNALKVLLIYFLKYVKNWEESSRAFPKFRADLLKFYESHRPLNYCYKNGFNTGVDIKLGYISPLKRVVKHLVFNKLKDNSFVRFGNVEDITPIIIYIEGGVTLREHREICEFASEHKIEVIVISNEVLNSSKFFNYAKG